MKPLCRTNGDHAERKPNRLMLGGTIEAIVPDEWRKTALKGNRPRKGAAQLKRHAGSQRHSGGGA